MPSKKLQRQFESVKEDMKELARLYRDRSGKEVPIETYTPPMHGSTERLARCCGSRFVGVQDGDRCPSCGARFTDQ